MRSSVGWTFRAVTASPWKVNQATRCDDVWGWRSLTSVRGAPETTGEENITGAFRISKPLLPPSVKRTAAYSWGAVSPVVWTDPLKKEVAEVVVAARRVCSPQCSSYSLCDILQ